MSFDPLSDLNWLAVIVATIAYFALGGLWYSPLLFAKPWQRAAGMVVEEGQNPGPVIYVAPLIANLIASVVTAMFAVATGSTTVGDGIVLGLLVGVGYAATVVGLDATFDTHKPDKGTWFAITAAYHVIGLMIVGAIVSIWD